MNKEKNWNVKEKTLSEKIFDRKLVLGDDISKIFAKDVKEKIQNAQRKLKELVIDSDYCVCCGHDEEKIFKAMNDIFKEEFGEELTK